jgi:anti-repressor protein
MSNVMTSVFTYEGNNIRTVMIDGEIWFVAKDVCSVLEIGDTSSALRRLDDDEKGTDSILTSSGKQEMLIVNESGLYELIFGSKKPEAKQFKRWVKSEVLPTIRKTGQYGVIDPVQQYLSMSDEDRGIAYFSELKQKKEMQFKLELVQPKANKYDAYMNVDGYMTVNDVAKVLDKGRNKLFAFLRSEGVLMDNNIPYQKHMNKFKVVVKVNGRHTNEVTLVNSKGFDYISSLTEIMA